MKTYIKYFLPIVLCISACKINQYKNNRKVGKWVEEQVEDGISYKFVGYYNKGGREKKTWKTYRNDTLVLSEKYKGDVSFVKNFYNNGKILSKGKSRTDRSNPEKLHWFYFGEWRYYSVTGDLEFKRLFEGGKEIAEIKINKKK